MFFLIEFRYDPTRMSGALRFMRLPWDLALLALGDEGEKQKHISHNLYYGNHWVIAYDVV